jgi:hypothetical protein
MKTYRELQELVKTIINRHQLNVDNIIKNALGNQ